MTKVQGKLLTSCFLSALFLLSSCTKIPEMTLEEIEAYKASASNSLVGKTIFRPWKSDPWVPGSVRGTWNTTVSADPKSFNMLIAERDGNTSGIIEPLTQYLFFYNVALKIWQPNVSDFKIVTDDEKGSLDVYCQLRDDLYWSFYQDRKPKVKVTSDDVVFWYDEICCDEAMGSSAYNSQFQNMEDGTVERITIKKIDDRSFVFHFPRIIADPLLALNMDFGPAFIYRKAKESGGAEAVKNLFTVAEDPKNIPSMGRYFITEYTPGQRIVYTRNPDYWEKDSNGVSYPYVEQCVAQIVSDSNTKLLMFKQGKFETFSPSPEQLEQVINDAEKFDYSVFNAGGNLSAPFWSFNQNPKNSDKPYYKWFCKKEFRQAMSCLLNRERIITESYRGLGEPKYSFFPEANPFYNENIILKYRFSHAHAKKLLAQAGFAWNADGMLCDEEGNSVEFDISIITTIPEYNDMAQIIVDECKKEGITVHVRPVDFQRLVEQLTSTYDWQTVLIGFGGSSIFPTQGNNVWLSSGNLHLWNPLQKSPATEWEAEIDRLYETARRIVDPEKARPYWEAYQELYLEECAIIYMVRGRSFCAINNRWDLSNFYFDNISGGVTEYLFLK